MSTTLKGACIIGQSGGPTKNKKAGGFGKGLVCGLLAAAVAVGGVAYAWKPLGKTTYEGPGFDSPEEAAVAYVEALAKMDVDAMISTYAVESFGENCDFEDYTDWLNCYTPTSTIPFPSDVGQGYDDMNTAAHLASIIDGIKWQILSLSLYDMAEYDPTTPVCGDAVEDLVDNFADKDNLERIASIEVVDTIDPEDLSEMYEDPRNRENMEKGSKNYGADEVESVVVEAEMDGETVLFFFDAYQYDDVWYVGNKVGNIGILLNVNYIEGFLIGDEAEDLL